MPTGCYDVEELSDDESEDSLLAEIQAISGARLFSPSKANVDRGDAAFEIPKPTASTPADLDFSDSDDDFELLRSIQQQYGGGVESGGDGAEKGLLSPRPLFTLPPVDSDAEEDDEDFDTLRAIQQRFGQYSSRQGPESESTPSSNRTLNGGSSGGGGGSGGIDPNIEEPTDHTAGSRSLGADEVCNLNVDMPPWALVFRDAIRKNRSLQKHLRAKMNYVEIKREEISKLKKRVQTILEYYIRCKRMIGRMLSRGQDDRMLLISSPETTSSFGPPENCRVANYRMAFQVYPQSFPREKWTRKERENLKKGIIQQYQNRLFQKSLDMLRVSKGPENVEVDQVMTWIGSVEMTPEKVRAFLPNVDWDLLASTYVPRRSGLECQARWTNHDDPLINWGKWTHMEEKSLLYIIQQKGMNDWIDKAVFLGSNRTPYQCLTRYQRSLNVSLIKREWTPDEDARLISAVEAFGESNWEVISSSMEGRTGPQCSNRWLKTLLPSKQKKGRWSHDEDIRLTIAVKLLGRDNKNWCKIAEFVPGRTQARCRDRWMNCLDPNLTFGEWTEENDKKLKEAVKLYGFRWSKVAKCVPSRTDNHCRRRWEVLFPEEISRVRQEKSVMRKVLPTNFVDREPNRPTLEANDFEPVQLVEAKPAKAKVDGVKKSRKRKRSNGNKIPLKKSDILNFSILKKPRSQRQRKMRRNCEFVPPGSCQVSEMVEGDISVSGSSLIKADESVVAAQNLIGLSLLSPPASSKQKLPSSGSKGKRAVQGRKKRASIACETQNKQTKVHAAPVVSSCKESVNEDEVDNDSTSSDIIALLTSMKVAGAAQQRRERKVGTYGKEPKKRQVRVPSSSKPSICNGAVEESSGGDLVRREASGTSSGKAKRAGKKHKEDRRSNVKSEDWEHLTLTELRRLSSRK